MNTIRKHPHAAIGFDGLAQIGMNRFQLRGIRFVDGEGGAAPVTPPTEPVAPPAPTPPAPSIPTPPAQPTPPAPVNYKGSPDEYVRELREESKTHRLAAEKAASDFTAAQAERDAAASERDALKRDNTIILRAGALGANAAALLDSKDFTTTFAGIDLADPAAVDKAITDAIEKNSTFRAGPKLPGTSGGGHQGGQPNTPKPTLQGAITARMQG